jgi:hypothetical protein
MTTTTNTTRRSGFGDTAWMAHGACLARGDLPWTTDPEQTTAEQLRVMAAICQDCLALSDCSAFASRAKVTGGFWAGRHRNIDAPSLAGPGWAAGALPGLGGLGGAA